MPQTSEIINLNTQQEVHNNPSKLLTGKIEVSKIGMSLTGTPDEALNLWEALKGTHTVEWKSV